MTELWVAHEGFISRSYRAVRLNGPKKNGFFAEERAAEALLIAGAGPKLLLSNGSPKCALQCLPKREPKGQVDPDDHVDSFPLDRLGAIVVPIENPTVAYECRFQFWEKLAVGGLLPV